MPNNLIAHTRRLFFAITKMRGDTEVVTRDNKDVNKVSTRHRRTKIPIITWKKRSAYRRSSGFHDSERLIKITPDFCRICFQATKNACFITISNWTIDHPRGRPWYRKCLAVTNCSWARWAKIRSDKDCWRPRNVQQKRCCSSRRDTIRVSMVSISYHSMILNDTPQIHACDMFRSYDCYAEKRTAEQK